VSFLDQTYLGNTIIAYLIFLGIIAASLVIGKIIFFISKKVIRAKAAQTETKFDDIIVHVMEKPLVFLIFIIGLIFALKTLTLSDGAEKFFSNVVKIILTIDLAWFIISFIDQLIVNYLTPITSKTKSELDDILVPLIRKLAKITLIFITVLIIIDNFGYDITSLLAGLGLGGLAFALAAKDMLANFFGGISIIGDKPFKPGDRIKVEGKDGWITEIGLRSTKMNTLDGFQLIVPNAIMANSILENVSREDSRKIKMVLGLEYSTSMKKMEEAKKILEDTIKKNKDTKDDSIVIFEEFGESSLNFLVIYWIKNLDNILTTKHQINMEIKNKFEKANINIAFPSSTIYLKK
ncbi:MAG: mechanosensitive ion channel family protein, partial [Nanoarchaeota archaeon]|nr:mechanosensitive ion channel family protein [Nanoarchaeota archaeon]